MASIDRIRDKISTLDFMKTNLWLIVAVALSTAIAAPRQTHAAEAAPGGNPPTTVPAKAEADKAPEPPAKAKAKPAETKAAKAVSTEKKATDKKAAAKTEPAPTPTLSPGPARVKENVRGVINVRGQASITSETVAQLKPGERITVLEEVVLKNPKSDEPARWAKISLPESAPVWIFSEYIDPATKTVTARRLNLRSGPGENFSVIGRVERGTPVRGLDTKGGWVRIETPKDAYAFVAAHLLTPEAAGPSVAAAEPKAPAPTPAVPKVPEPAPVAPAPATPVPETTVAAPVTPAPAQDPGPAPAAPKQPETAPGTPVVATPPPTPPPVEPAAPAPTPVSTGPTTPIPVVPEPPLIEEPKRVVTREGVVRRSVSIQAPAYFVLESLDTGKPVNYLFSTNVALRDYKGRRIVVTGEEVLDERWPNTPVISLDEANSIDVIP
jgi:hypothetical protein